MSNLFDRNNTISFLPKYKQLGSNYFVQRPGRQQEDGLKLVKQYDFLTIREHIKGIKENNYEFYDEYPNCKEVLILGAANSGKSSLINALNGAYAEGLGGERVAYTAK